MNSRVQMRKFRYKKSHMVVEKFYGVRWSIFLSQSVYATFTNVAKMVCCR